MKTKIFLNLPIKDLQRSVAFFTQLGFTFNPKFTDENATCMIVNEDIYIMLLVEKFFLTFTKKSICDTKTSTEALIALSFESKEAVDAMMAKVLAAGGTEPKPATDRGFMYSRDFEDIDGHNWELFWMDPSATA